MEEQRLDEWGGPSEVQGQCPIRSLLLPHSRLTAYFVPLSCISRKP